MTSRKVLIIFYRKFGVGGIENYSITLIKNALLNNHRVILIGSSSKEYAAVYKDVLEDNRIEFVPYNYSTIKTQRFPNINLSHNEEATIIVYELARVFTAFQFKKRNPNQIKILYLIPHFTGDSIFLEQSFSYPLNNFIRKTLSKVYLNLYKQGIIRFFNIKHAVAIEETYSIKLPNAEKYCIPRISNRKAFDEKKRRDVYKRPEFTIISAGRMELPHKGYVIGLIKTFAELIKEYRNIKLLIIGTGVDEPIVRDAISKLDYHTQELITIKAPVTPDKLERIFCECNLNISVAGCATIGARCGVPTLPARHYTYDCEVYGYIPDSINKTISTEPGEDVKIYLENILNMSESEYLSLCSRSYHAYDYESPADMDFPFNQIQDNEYIPCWRDSSLVNLLFHIQRCKYFIKNRIQCFLKGK